MNKLFLTTIFASAASFAVSAFAGPPVSLVPAHCALTSTSCLFSGNANGTLTNSIDIDTAYNGQSPGPAPLLALDTLLVGTVDGSLLSDPHSGTYTAGFLVDFFAVKAGDGFMLYELASPSTTFSWSTAGLVNKKGIEQDVSHLTFWGTGVAIPEPTTWALMIVGFGLIGSTMRQSRRQKAVAI